MAGRPSKTRESEEDATPRLPALNGVDGDFTVEALGVSDGFRPESWRSHSARPGGTSASTADHASNDVAFSPKATTQEDPFSSANDPLHRTTSVLSTSTVSAVPSTYHRSLSPVSAFSIPHAQSPVQGQSGPTHPYGYYPQGTQLARTASVATSSTVRAPEPAHQTGAGPQHPYALYPQNVTPAGQAETSANPAAVIPVGFPGMAHHYQRRLGPEGEEAADIIGSDGHTEQLPPYTRYPMDIPPKASEAPPAVVLDPVNTRNPGPSQDSLDSPESRLSARSVVSDSSGAQLNTAGAADTERSGNLKEKWDDTRKKRFCFGKLPFWAVVVGIIFLVIACTVIGGVVGATLVRRHHRPPARPSPTLADSAPASVVTVTKDYSPIPTLPPNTPQLPVGNYSMDMPFPSESNSSCVSDTEPNAWSCLISPTSGLLLSVMPRDGTGMNFFQLIQDNTSAYPQLGMQPPVMNGPSRFAPVMDKEDENRGPAYFFELSYNKTVIVAPEKINVTPPTRRAADVQQSKRARSPRAPVSFGYRHDEIAAGQLPWYCMWNNTVLQGFVYLRLNSSGSLNPSTTTITTTPTMTGSPYGSPTPQTLTRYPHYPRLIKLDEQRNSSAPNYVKPYCQQMRVLDDYEVVPNVDPHGDKIIVQLDEFGSNDQISGRSGEEDLQDIASGIQKRATGDLPCHCQWELL